HECSRANRTDTDMGIASQIVPPRRGSSRLWRYGNIRARNCGRAIRVTATGVFRMVSIQGMRPGDGPARRNRGFDDYMSSWNRCTFARWDDRDSELANRRTTARAAFANFAEGASTRRKVGINLLWGVRACGNRAFGRTARDDALALRGATGTDVSTHQGRA